MTLVPAVLARIGKEEPLAVYQSPDGAFELHVTLANFAQHRRELVLRRWNRTPGGMVPNTSFQRIPIGAIQPILEGLRKAAEQTRAAGAGKKG